MKSHQPQRPPKRTISKIPPDNQLFVPLPPLYWALLLLTLLCYVGLTQLIKTRLIRKAWV
jgi:hypothetical protein